MPEDEDNTMKILIATDIHLGYMEKDGQRGEDTINTFEEILEIAKKEDVDFILFGGDLFHENKPSRKILHQCMQLLRRYCLGDKPCQIEFLSDPSVNFAFSQFPCVNYEDPNFNVAIPVFSIHGNHDDPTGPNSLCSLDLLSVAGLLNYFGKTASLETIEMSPVLLQKGTTKLALYGLGSVRDERLHRLFTTKQVKMLRPRENSDSWFNLFTIHQNRAQRGKTNYIPEHFLDDFIDLVLWGHEHECRIDPEWNGIRNFYVTQPGSPVATSLIEGESKEKHVGILRIKQKNFKLTKVPLKSVRPFYIEDLCLLETGIDPNHTNEIVQKKVEKYLMDKVNEYIKRAAEEPVEHPKRPKLPLIRLRVDSSGGFETFNAARFGQKFIDSVANPKDILDWHKKRVVSKDKKPGDVVLPNDVQMGGLDKARVHDMVKTYFESTDENNQMRLLSENGLGMAVQDYVDKEEKEAITELVKHQLVKTQDHLKGKGATIGEGDIDNEIVKYKNERKKNSGEEKAELDEAKKRARASQNVTHDVVDNSAGLNSDSPTSDLDSDENTSTRGRGRGRGRGSRGSRGASAKDTTTTGHGRGTRVGRGSRGRKQPVVEETESIINSFKKSTRRGGASKSAAVVHVLSESDEESDVSTKASNSRTSKRKSQTSASSMRKKSYFEDSDDDDGNSFSMPTSKRRR